MMQGNRIFARLFPRDEGVVSRVKEAPHMKRGIVQVTLLTFVVSVAAVSAAFGQATTGEITGRVADATGQVITGATVTVVNTATGLSRTTTTSAVGEFLVTLLPPGRYTVSAEQTGFKKAVRSD